MAATYQVIAAEIRQRIIAGQLRPGERVPSARAITREWGVAVATATKALQALQADGLVRGVVGVGTVVNDRPQQTAAPAGGGIARSSAGTGLGPRRAPRDVRHAREGQGTRSGRVGRDGRDGSSVEAELTRERIVRRAVAIADGEGLPAVTMRRLAVELDVAVMSLYRYVASKDDLVVLMVDQVMGEAALPDPLPAGWRARIEAMARQQWAVIKRHPWMASGMSMTRPFLAPNGMAHTDGSLGVLSGLGFDPDTALEIYLAVIGFIFGVAASLQLELEAERETGQSYAEWVDQSDQVMAQLRVAERFPHLAAVQSPPNLDRVFDAGLSLMLDGLARRLPAAEPSP
jgi:AcrR family transcriptional regulator